MPSQLIRHAPDSEIAGHLRACSFDASRVALVAKDAHATEEAPKGGFIWFDVTDPTAEGMRLLQERFKLHPLAVEDALHAHQRSKVEHYPGFVLVVVHSVFRDAEQHRLGLHELNLFIGENFVISVRHGHGFKTEDITERWDRLPREWQSRPSSLFYVLLDQIVDEYAPFADDLENELRDLRHLLIGDAPRGKGIIREIFVLGELAATAHTVAFPLTDVLTDLLHAGEPVVSEAEVPYFRDIRDHAQHVVARLAHAQAMADRAVDLYHVLENSSQGAVSKRLTQLATVFLPLTFLTGFFGQNFGFLVNALIVSRTSFWVFCVGGELLALLLTILYVRRIDRK